MSEFRFDKQVVIVTGAGGGLGKAYALLLAKQGAIVVVHDAGVNLAGLGHSSNPAEQVAEQVRALGAQALVQTQNLATREACQELIQNTVAQYGRLDALIHSAGLVAYKGIADTSVEEWQKLKEVNIEAPFWLCQSAFPVMKMQLYGRIVLTVSGYGLKSFENSDVTAYGVGKAAQFGLMNGLAGEGAESNILVNAISPVAATRMFRTKVNVGEMSAEAVAPVAVFLASQACNVTGKVVNAVDGKVALSEVKSSELYNLAENNSLEAIQQWLAKQTSSH